MSYNDPNQNQFPETYVPSPNDINSNEGMQKVKLYQAFIFSIPICFTFIVLFVFYVIYLRRRDSNVDWSSLGMRGSFVPNNNNLSVVELGLSKELREMLPIVIYKESFSVKDSECSVCLGEYKANEKLQKMPACGHTFHMDCIDIWLTSHSTCPLCRLSLISKSSLDLSHQTPEVVSSMENSNGGESSSQLTTEAISNTNYDLEGHRDNIEVLQETKEDGPNRIGTSNAS